MEHYLQAAIGLILLLVVVGGLLFIYYSRTNAVEKTGYGALIMLAIVSLMIPVLWIYEGNQQASAKESQFAASAERGMRTYAANCSNQCFAIDPNKNTVINPTYDGYTFNELNSRLDPDIRRIISAGNYKEGAPRPANFNENALPRAEQFGGGLLSNDIDDILNFVRSSDRQYLQKNGYPTKNWLPDLPAYLQANSTTQYAAAVSFFKNGQFGEAADKTGQNQLTIDIVDPGKEGVNCASQDGCFQLLNVKVKVGTQITWVNKASKQHTVTATNGQDLSQPKAASQIFDSKSKFASTNGLLSTNDTFTYTVTQSAYNFDPSSHTIVYYCTIHPNMLAKLTIVP